MLGTYPYYSTFFLVETLVMNYKHDQWLKNLSIENEWNLTLNMIWLEENNAYLIVSLGI